MAWFGEFRDDDAGYLAWLADHPEGYVINVARSHNVTQARMHLANCQTIRNQNSAGSTWTGPYVKVCADDLAELEKWAIETVGQADLAVRDLPPGERHRADHPDQAEESDGRRRCVNCYEAG